MEAGQLVKVNIKIMTAIGIDLGGTRIKAVLMDTDGNLLEKLYMPTNDGDDKVWKQTIKEVVDKLSAITNNNHLVVGMSAPGLPDEANKAIAFMPGRLQGLEQFTWSDFLEHPTYILNDGVAALIAEAKSGAAKNKKHVAMLTIGTGVGGAILINGVPYLGAFNKAGHIGHMVIDHEGEADVTGMPGSLEECIGNCTISKRTNGKYFATHDLLQAVNKGDAFAVEVWLKSVRQLAMGIASLTNILSPEVIVLGGGITEANDDLFVPLKKYMQQYEWRANSNGVEIVKAMHGDLAGAIGAAFFAVTRQNLINNKEE